MTSGEFEVGPALDNDLAAVPDCPAVFLVWPKSGEALARPYLSRTGFLRRRLRRLLGEESAASRRLNLRGIAGRVEYRLTASKLEASLLFYEMARSHFPQEYERMVRLRPPPFVKVLLANEFPRTTVTTRLTASGAFLFGPFRTRVAAERFEQEALDLFQVRRCQEDLVPSPAHPGCIYGEMMRCLRPCQQIVGVEEYRSEVNRLVEFLASGGASQLHSIASARERFSEEMQFEEARRQHERYQRVEQVLRLRDELATGLQHLCGVAVLGSADPATVALRFFIQGVWLPESPFSLVQGGDMVPMDRRLREIAGGLKTPRISLRERQEHVALLARWYYSSWRDGEWIPFPEIAEMPYRRVVRAISHVASTQQALPF
jgi:excinuclease UvrABC nuclease subunit